MKASLETISKKDIVICMIDEWNEGKKNAFDCNILSMDEGHVDVVYLSGHRSRNDRVPYADVVAKVDKSKPEIKVADGAFSGYFVEFDKQAS